MELSGLHNSWLFTGLIALGCAIDVDRLGAGKPCTSDGRCADGYHCSAERRCEASPVSRDAAAGSAGTAAGDSGSGDESGSGARARNRTRRAKCEDGASFDASLPDANDRDGTLADASGANDAPPPDTGCASPTRYYVDGDHDGFGRDDSAVWACARPSGSWATRGADCNDADNRVFPGQTAFFASPFTYGGAIHSTTTAAAASSPTRATGSGAELRGSTGDRLQGCGFTSTVERGEADPPVAAPDCRVRAALLVCSR